MNKKLKIFCTLSLFGTLLGSGTNVYAMMRGQPPEDPVSRINYRNAFNQDNIYEKHERTLQKLSTLQSLGDSVYENVSLEKKPGAYEPLNSEEETEKWENYEPTPEWEAYKKACLSRLRSERRWAITDKGRDSASTLVLVAAATAAGVRILESDSYGQGFILFAGLFNSVFFLHDIIGNTFSLKWTPSHPVDELEKKFAENKCFIPNQLWPALINNFMVARQNPFSQQKSLDLINFTLGLTICRPMKSIKSKNILSALNIISKKIDDFFKDYNIKDSEAEGKTPASAPPTLEDSAPASALATEQKDKEPQANKRSEQYQTLKFNILKFVSSVLGDNDKLTRYLYLRGPGGIGKTHFANELCDWVKSATEDAVYSDNFVITSAKELEGSDDSPGVFLRVLRNQCVSRKRGSIVLMDEADWLNEREMLSASKRVFNGELAKLSTTYYGAGIDGTGIHLKIPPTLLIAIGNPVLTDEALKSRFDAFDFPLPKKGALLKYAHTVLERNYGKLQNAGIDRKAIPNFDKRIQECTSFRDVEAIVPALISEAVWGEFKTEESDSGAGAGS